MIILGGLGILWQGQNLEWFLAALETGKLHNKTYFLAWAIVGLAYSLLASFVWLRWSGQPGRVRRVLVLLFVVALMITGSQMAARRVMNPLGVIIAGIDWDPDSQEFVIDVYAYPTVAESCMRGDLQAIVSVEGLWWSPSDKKSPQPLLASEVEGFSVGAPDLLGRRPATHARVRMYSDQRSYLGTLRVPWKPSRVKPGSVCVVWVNVAFVNRQGKRVGRELAYWRGVAIPNDRVWISTDPDLKRTIAFIDAGRKWIRDPDWSRVPFQVRPPPPPGVVRENVRVNPRK